MKLLVDRRRRARARAGWKLAQSPRVAKVFVAPGNAGTARETGLENVAAGRGRRTRRLRLRERVALTVVGPEAPLAAGVVDAFRAAGLQIFGPTRAAAQLESSKDFAKAFMVRHGIPTAAYATFTEPPRRTPTSSERGAPIVVKADGLAAGKGVVVATTRAEAHAAIDVMLVGNGMGDAGARVVIEEFLDGRGGELHRDGRRPQRAAAGAAARTTSACSTATAAPTPAAWAPTRRRRWSRRRCTRGSCARSSCRRCRAWRRTACRTPVFSTPA